MPKLIEKGLRAELITQSLITGQLMIEINFFPETPIILHNLDKKYIEIPTTPSRTKQLERNLETALAGIDRFVNNPDLAASIRALKETLQTARQLAIKVDRQVNPVAGGVKNTAADFRKLARDLDSRVGGVAAGLNKTMTAARGALSEDSPLIVELEGTLKEIAAASRSLRQLADYLEEHPESLIRGKGKPGNGSGGK